MMQNTGIKPEDLYRMAQHIVYSLYDGINPFSARWENLMVLNYLWNEEGGPEDK